MSKKIKTACARTQTALQKKRYYLRKDYHILETRSKSMAYIRYGELEETTCEYCGCPVTPDDEPVDLPIWERTGYACQECYKEVADIEQLEKKLGIYEPYKRSDRSGNASIVDR